MLPIACMLWALTLPTPRFRVVALAASAALVPWAGLQLIPYTALLGLLMLLVVTGVGGAIHIYSWGYMRDDRGFSRYFAGLSLFTFSMLGIVLANNFLMLFIFWELVGVSSYLLIGHWFENKQAVELTPSIITLELGVDALLKPYQLRMSMA